MPQRWTTAEWRAADGLLLYRSRGRCEVCWEELTNSDEVARHHRQRRAVGGDRLANLILIHGDCHRRVHANPEDARAKGWIVSSYADPASTPLSTPRGPVLLDDDGMTTPQRKRPQE